MTSRNPRSTGEVISTIAFVGVSLWFASEALVNEGAWWRGALLWIASVGSMAGAFRFLIGRLFRK